jgi:hypothetical protein
LEGQIMGSINNISGSGYLPLIPQRPGGAKGSQETGEQTSPHISKPNSDEAYITSCRPTRLSIELIAQIRAKEVR